MYLTKFQLEMLYNKANVYGAGQEDDVFIGINIVELIIYSKKQSISLHWRADLKDWVEIK